MKIRIRVDIETEPAFLAALERDLGRPVTPADVAAFVRSAFSASALDRVEWWAQRDDGACHPNG